MLNPQQIEMDMRKITGSYHANLYKEGMSESLRSKLIMHMPRWAISLEHFANTLDRTKSDSMDDIRNIIVKLQPVIRQHKDISSISRLINAAERSKYDSKYFW